MNKNLLRSILLIITYSVVLVLVLVKIDLIWAVAAQILGALKPRVLGCAIAFVLNRPCTFFFRLYHGGLAGRKLDRFSRPLAVLSAYVALVVVVTALFSIMEKGSSVMQSTFGLSSSVSQILQGIILFAVLAADFFTRFRLARRAAAPKEVSK